MQLTVHGKQMDVGDALRTHVQDKLTDINQKYFNRAAYATVTFSREGHGHPQTRTQILIQLGKNIQVVSDALSPDPYAAFDVAADKVGKQMRRYKRKLRDHHDRAEHEEVVRATYSSLAAPEQDDEPQEDSAQDEPLVIAEMSTNVETMSVSEAVMRIDLSGANAFMFRNSKNKQLNVIYRRQDGNIGWINPETDK